MKEQLHTIAVRQVFQYWLLTIVLGGFLVPIAGAAFHPEDYSLGTIIPSFLLYFITGLIFSLPSLGALLMLCRWLNGQQLLLIDYCLKQNCFHLLIALASFSAYGWMMKELILPITIGFTTAGLIVWNTGFLLAAKNRN